MFVIVYREMRATERMINDITNDIVRDITTSVITHDSRQLAVDFHTTHVVQRLDMLCQCCHAVEMLRVRSYLNLWKTRLAGITTRPLRTY